MCVCDQWNHTASKIFISNKKNINIFVDMSSTSVGESRTSLSKKKNNVWTNCIQFGVSGLTFCHRIYIVHLHILTKSVTHTQNMILNFRPKKRYFPCQLGNFRTLSHHMRKDIKLSWWILSFHEEEKKEWLIVSKNKYKSDLARMANRLNVAYWLALIV